MTSVRLGCGNAIISGENEAEQQPDGPSACVEAETPRDVAGRCLAVLAVLGVLGLLGAVKLPVLRGPSASRPER